MTKNLSRRLFLLFFSLLSLCVSPAWGLNAVDYGSNPTSGGSFYIFNVGQKFFLKAATNDFDYTTPSVLWSIIQSGDQYKIYDGSSNYIYLKKDGSSYSVEVNNSGNTARIGSSNTTIGAYKIYRTDNTKYLNFDNNKLTPANTSGGMNDWVFMTTSQYSDFQEDLRAEVISNIATYLPSTNGWSRITAMPTNPSNYYYCLVSINAQNNLMLSLQTGSENGSGNKAAFYKNSKDPLTDNTFLWEFASATTNPGYFTIQNKSKEGKYLFSPESNEHKFYTNDSETSEANTHYTYRLTYDNGYWVIENSSHLSWQPENDKYLGLWNPQYGYSDGKELAANKDISNAGRFHIYAIKKTDVDVSHDDEVIDASWIESTGTYTAQNYPERYSGSGAFSVGEIMYQSITNLDNGYYMVEFYAALNKANGVSNTNSGDNYAVVFANDATQPLSVQENNDYTFNTSSDVKRIIAYVSNGTLIYGVRAIAANGGNWCVAKAKALTKLSLGEITDHIIINATINQTNGNNSTLPNGWQAVQSNGNGSGNGTYTKGTGDTYLENWNGSAANFNVDFYQVVTLNAGTYRFQADMFFNNAEGALALYARYDDTDHYSTSSRVYVNTNGDQANNGMNSYTLDFTLAEAKTVRLGVKKIADSDGTWMGADNFKLYYVAAPNKSKSLTNSYGMLYNQKYNILIDNANTQAYAATYNESNEEVTLHALFNGGDKIIPAGNVVLLKNTNSESSISYRYVSTGTPVTIPDGNCFVHHDNAADASHTDYVLKNEGGVVAFYRFDAACSALDGYNVLRLPIENTHIGGGSAPSMIRIVTEGDNATALVPVYEDKTQGKQINDGRIYTILGVPVSDMSRPGIYIQNGKKYVVR